MTPSRSLTLWFIVGLAAACSRNAPTSAQDPGAPEAAAAASTIAPPSPSSLRAPQPVVANPIEARLVVIAKRWNDALAARDTRALSDVYGAHVRLYENTASRDAAIKTKAAALAATPDYTQSIGAIEIDLRKADRPKALFDKTWTAKGKKQTVRGSLVFAEEGGEWRIVEESDAPTDQRRARAAAADSCESLVVAAVASTPEASRLLNGPTDPSAGHTSNGLRIGGGPPEDPTYGVAVHENHVDRLVTLAWFDVDPKTGKVSGDDGTALKADPAIVAKMKAACAR